MATGYPFTSPLSHCCSLQCVALFRNLKIWTQVLANVLFKESVSNQSAEPSKEIIGLGAVGTVLV